MADDLAHLDATAQAELVRRGEIRPRELVDAAIERLERLNPRLNAVIHTRFARARAEADRLVPAEGLPFPGVPTLMKDLGGAEADEPCNAGMRVLRLAGWREREDSHVTRKLREAGLISLGRTNVPELATLPVTEPEAYGPSRNPWSLERSPGGSSGGAAAAVAAGIVPVAHGTDGGGSIRGPASMCGLVGLKPTRGRCSLGPQRGERWSGLSCDFMLTRSVRDAARLLDCLGGAVAGDPYAAQPPERGFARACQAPPASLRVARIESVGPLEVHPESIRAADRLAHTLELLGHHVEVARPEAMADGAYFRHWLAIVSSNVAAELDTCAEILARPVQADDVEPLTWALAERGRALSAPQLVASLAYMHTYGRRMASFFERFDLLLTPTQAAPPPEIGYVSSTREEPFRAYSRSAPYGLFLAPFNLSGQPALSLPVHVSAEGLPMGAQLAGAMHREDLLLAVAAQVEQASPWEDRHPPLFG